MNDKCYSSELNISSFSLRHPPILNGRYPFTRAILYNTIVILVYEINSRQSMQQYKTNSEKKHLGTQNMNKTRQN